jgi:hypothetical protein
MIASGGKTRPVAVAEDVGKKSRMNPALLLSAGGIFPTYKNDHYMGRVCQT